jgi:hypothetical protein
MARAQKKRSQRGVALLATFLIFTLLAVAGAMYVDHSTLGIRTSNRRLHEIQCVNLCEAGAQEVALNLWLPFKSATDFTNFDPSVQGASAQSPMAAVQDSIPGVGMFAAGVIAVQQPDTYTRIVTIRTVGWIDENGNGQLDPNEPSKTVDITQVFSLDRSKVFDYTYFVNNYGWWDGFQPDWAIINGDMRANGDFNFTNGTPTVNGSVYACQNPYLSPANVGLVNEAPYKWDNDTYTSQQDQSDPNSANNEQRWRQAYNSSTFGQQGSNEYETYKDLTFNTTGSIDTTSNTLTGSIVGDANGYDSWIRDDPNTNAATTQLDSTPTQEVEMPDLSDISYYQNLSQNYVDTTQFWNDGTPNPNYNQGAWVKVWNDASNSYQTVSTNGNISGSAIITGTSQYPILIHGPVTVSQDVLVKGTVSGQGTIYAGRNVHIIGSVIYNTPPNFTGSDPTAIDNQNQKADLLALAARGSVIMGDTTQFSYSWPLQYMCPPFTLGRYDDNGNWIPPYNCYDTDSTGRMLYQSVIPDDEFHSLCEEINQFDAVLYTNFVGGGNIGTGGQGMTFNGSLISKNEAMVVWSLPMRMNYDTRIHERSLTQTPLIDVDLPRSPSVTPTTWQDRGFNWNNEVQH